MNRKPKQVSLEPYGFTPVRRAPVASGPSKTMALRPPQAIKSPVVEMKAAKPEEIAHTLDVDEVTALRSPASKTGNNAGCIAGFIIMVVGVVVFASLATPSSGTNSSSYSASNHDAGMACIMAEKLIKPQLKAPKSAEFDYGDCRDSATRSGNTWTLHSYVDADNSFGAHIRTYYVAQLTNVPPIDTWRLVALSFDEP